ncbi:hypothetical protein FJU08_18740 [Martelella alba]|uniref:Uncharacterized protein n=1 Tax=Martelella alba TaxID=2590451 RepID=A0A506U2Q4_9HYPH|nr:hypothetical protein [Martelella alba]TPW28080.1 hypothetical protein FJU08_18740 [Martelella alba]
MAPQNNASTETPQRQPARWPPLSQPKKIVQKIQERLNALNRDQIDPQRAERKMRRERAAVPRLSSAKFYVASPAGCPEKRPATDNGLKNLDQPFMDRLETGFKKLTPPLTPGGPHIKRPAPQPPTQTTPSAEAAPPQAAPRRSPPPVPSPTSSHLTQKTDEDRKSIRSEPLVELATNKGKRNWPTPPRAPSPAISQISLPLEESSSALGQAPAPKKAPAPLPPKGDPEEYSTRL